MDIRIVQFDDYTKKILNTIRTDLIIKNNKCLLGIICIVRWWELVWDIYSLCIISIISHTLVSEYIVGYNLPHWKVLINLSICIC